MKTTLANQSTKLKKVVSLLTVVFSSLTVNAYINNEPGCKLVDPSMESERQLIGLSQRILIDDQDLLNDLSGLCHLYRIKEGADESVETNWKPVGDGYVLENFNQPIDSPARIVVKSTGHSLTLDMEKYDLKREAYKAIKDNEVVKVKCDRNEFKANIVELTKNSPADGEFKERNDYGLIKITDKNSIKNIKPIVQFGLPTKIVNGEEVFDEEALKKILKDYDPVIIGHAKMADKSNPDSKLYATKCNVAKLYPSEGILSFHCDANTDMSGSLVAFAKKTNSINTIGKILKFKDSLVTFGQLVTGSQGGSIYNGRGSINVLLTATETNVLSLIDSNMTASLK